MAPLARQGGCAGGRPPPAAPGDGVTRRSSRSARPVAHGCLQDPEQAHTSARLGKPARVGAGWGRLPVSRANPVTLSGIGSRLRYAGSCTFTMRATLSSTMVAPRSPAAVRAAAPAPKAEAAGGREGGAAPWSGGDLPRADWQRERDVCVAVQEPRYPGWRGPPGSLGRRT